MAQMCTEKEEFEFFWKIENFSLCPQSRGAFIQSPSFFIGALNTTKWHIRLYPRGRNDENIACDIFRETGPAYMAMNYRFSLVIDEIVQHYEFNAESFSFPIQGSKSQKLVARKTILEQKHLFLPNDTLTIFCRFWADSLEIEKIKPNPAIRGLLNFLCGEKADDQSFPIPSDVWNTTGTVITELKRKLYPYLNKCLARTRMGIERRSFTWPIKSISKFKLNQEQVVSLVCPEKQNPVFILKFFLNAEEFQVEIRKLAHGDFEYFFVICRLAVLDINGREHFSSEKEHCFGSSKSEELWSFPSFFNKKELVEAKKLCYPNDILSLRCSFLISTKVEFSNIEEYSYISLEMDNLTNISDLGTLTEDLKSFYIDEKLFDVDLCVEGKMFKAHQVILASRSPVFRAMFEHDTKEKKTSSVEIPDVDPQTLKQMLTFMYTDSVGDLQSLSAVKLYSAADKYQIVSLKKKCSDYLVSNISPGNVCQALLLADLHQDKELKKAAYDHLFKPPYTMLFSPEFEQFISNSTALAHDTLRTWIQTLKCEASKEIK